MQSEIALPLVLCRKNDRIRLTRLVFPQPVLPCKHKADEEPF